MRAPSVFGAVLVVLCGGCIYATGVQDYKVDDNTNGVSGGGDDTACGAQTSFSNCEICCASNHPDDKFRQLDALRACACTPDKCQTPCSQDDGTGNNFCSDARAGFSTACDNCLASTTQGGQCPLDTTNPYDQCLGNFCRGKP